MKTNVNCKSIISIDIDCDEAFRLLTKTLDMDFILNDEDRNKCYTYKNKYDEVCVYKMIDGHEELFDDRGELFELLISLAKHIFPNL